MYAAPVGMLGLGDVIIVTDVRNLGWGECWVRLEKETTEKCAFATWSILLILPSHLSDVCC